jgi:hypothetical protein
VHEVGAGLGLTARITSAGSSNEAAGGPCSKVAKTCSVKTLALQQHHVGERCDAMRCGVWVCVGGCG